MFFYYLGASIGSTPRSFDITIGCTDTGSPPLEVLTTVTVSLYDTNRPPIFDPSSITSFTISENVNIKTNVGNPVQASDANAGDVLTYSILSESVVSQVTGNSTFSSSPSLFEMESSTGQLYTKAVSTKREINQEL